MAELFLIKGKVEILGGCVMTVTPVEALHQLWSENLEGTNFVSLFLDLLPLEQDAVFGLEALLVLCSQDDSPGAQATLKVTLL